ncbi:MAG: adenosylcobinamide-GDP ribazoletransferase [Thermodesulfobacteriota bacterium]
MTRDLHTRKTKGKKRSPISGFGSALTTLTAVPWRGAEEKELSDSLPWFPIVGLCIGLIVYAIGWIWNFLLFLQWPSGAALIMVFVAIWATRGLHLDGLADWADSAGGLFDNEARLAIMKDVRLGTFGILALIVAVTAQWLAFARLISSGSLAWVLPVFVLSRSMMVELITTLPYARSGEGMAKPFVAGASPRHRISSHVLSFAFCLLYGPLGAALFGMAGTIVWLFKRYCRRRYGGITGDLLGAANEMVEVGLLMVCALPGNTILTHTGWTWLIS